MCAPTLPCFSFFYCICVLCLCTEARGHFRGLGSLHWVPGTTLRSLEGQQAPLPAESHLTRLTLLLKTDHPWSPELAVSARLVDQENPKSPVPAPPGAGVTGVHHRGFSVDVRDWNTSPLIYLYGDIHARARCTCAVFSFHRVGSRDHTLGLTANTFTPELSDQSI